MTYTKNKAIAAAVGSLLTLLGASLVDGLVDGGEGERLITEVIGLALTVYSVYKARNKPLPPKNSDTRPLV